MREGGVCNKCGGREFSNLESIVDGCGRDQCINCGNITVFSDANQTIAPGYEPLAAILQEALDQAQYGKGKRCHANGKPFLEQPIMVGARECGPGSMAYQARKKILEALNCTDDERAIEDLLGAINYTAAMVILRRENKK